MIDSSAAGTGTQTSSTAAAAPILGGHGIGDLVQTEAGDLAPVLATTVENALELITTRERITIKLLQ